LGFTEYVEQNREKAVFLFLLLILANMLLIVDFFGNDPHWDAKSNYYYGQSGSRGENGTGVTLWNRNLNCGLPQYNKVFWDRYPAFYRIFASKLFFILLTLCAVTGVHHFLKSAKYSYREIITGALLYGLGMRFLTYLPVWHYGWELMLLFLPWIAFSLQHLRNGGSILYSAFLALLLYLSFLLFESELIIYLLLAIIIYLLYSFEEMLEHPHRFFSYLIFLGKAMLGIFLGIIAAIYPYVPLIQAQSGNLAGALQEVSLWRLTGIIILESGMFFLLRLGQKRLLLSIWLVLLMATVMYVFTQKVPRLDKEEKKESGLQLQSELVDILQMDNTQFRVYPLGRSFMENRWSVATESIGGNTDYQMERYRQAMRKCLSVETDKNLMINWNFLKMLNVKYLISAVKIPSYRIEYRHFSPDEKMTLYQVLETPKYAWFAREKQVLGQEEILNKLIDPEFDPHQIAFLESEIPEFKIIDLLPEPVNSFIVIEKISAEYIRLKVRNDKAGLLVLSELYAENKDWKAYIDRETTEIYPADYLLRSIVVPAGTHQIEMRYKPENLEKYRRYSFLARMAILLLLAEELLYLLWRRRF
jgi:hypothetical protein